MTFSVIVGVAFIVFVVLAFIHVVISMGIALYNIIVKGEPLETFYEKCAFLVGAIIIVIGIGLIGQIIYELFL